MTYREKELLQSFYNDLSRFQELSKEEELLLIEKAQGCDHDALNKLIEHNFREAIEYALKGMRSRFQDVDFDTTYDIALKAIQRAVERFDLTRYDKFIPLVKHIIKLRIIDLYRKKDRILLSRLNDDAFSIIEDQPEDYSVLMKFIERLPKRTREILTWYFKLGKDEVIPEQEIADKYSISVSRVMAIVREGIESLRSYKGFLRSA